MIRYFYGKDQNYTNHHYTELRDAQRLYAYANNEEDQAFGMIFQPDFGPAETPLEYSRVREFAQAMRQTLDTEFIFAIHHSFNIIHIAMEAFVQAADYHRTNFNCTSGDDPLQMGIIMARFVKPNGTMGYCVMFVVYHGTEFMHGSDPDRLPLYLQVVQL